MDGYPNEKFNLRVNHLDQRKRKILADNEAIWRLRVERSG